MEEDKKELATEVPVQKQVIYEVSIKNLEQLNSLIQETTSNFKKIKEFKLLSKTI